MAKVSIGLRGWRFEEEDVFTDAGSLRPLGEMPEDAERRFSRLAVLVGSPCDCCWLIHGDEDLKQCNVAAAVYGEPLSEVLLCPVHEDDFVYWFREAGGSAYRGERELQDAFHEWFLDGGRAPKGYEGVEHVDTAPGELPQPADPELGKLDVELPEEEQVRIDLRDGEVYEGPDAASHRDTERSEESAGEEEPADLADADVDLTRDYPS